MSRLYLELDAAVERVVRLAAEYDLTVGTPDNDKEWLRNELEQVCEIRVCNLCRGVDYTTTPFTVITQMGRRVEAVFNFCPVCGRDLRPWTTDTWGENDIL